MVIRIPLSSLHQRKLPKRILLGRSSSCCNAMHLIPENVYVLVLAAGLRHQWIFQRQRVLTATLLMWM